MYKIEHDAKLYLKELAHAWKKTLNVVASFFSSNIELLFKVKCTYWKNSNVIHVELNEFSQGERTHVSYSYTEEQAPLTFCLFPFLCLIWS